VVGVPSVAVAVGVSPLRSSDVSIITVIGLAQLALAGRAPAFLALLIVMLVHTCR
jgi:hypothetical protein